MQNDLITIIVPIYNCEKYISRCINSIIYQTYKNIEIILIDDGSSDNSGHICDEFANIDTRIRVIHKENEGAGMARNDGLDSAKGKYVTFIDSDDYIAPFFVENLYRLAEKNDCQIVQCGYVLGYDEKYHFSNTIKNIQVYNHEEIFYHRKAKIIICSKLFLRTLFNEIRYPRLSVHDDEFMTYKLFYSANRIGIIEDKYYYYYQSADSIMRTKREYHPENFIEAYNERIQFFKARDEIELTYISYKEKCIRLMLLYFACKLDVMSKNDTERIYNDYKRDYAIAMRAKHKSLKEVVSLKLFYYFPGVLLCGVKWLKMLK